MSNKIDKILAEISAGELFDKITILEIKKAKISDKEKLIDINRELSSLNEAVKKFIPDQTSILKYINDLVFSRIRFRRIHSTGITTISQYETRW